MLRSLKEVQSDDSVVGFYQATTLGAFFDQTLVETQAIHQDKLRHGGVIIVHGLYTFTPPERVDLHAATKKIFRRRHEGMHISVRFG